MENPKIERTVNRCFEILKNGNGKRYISCSDYVTFHFAFPTNFTSDNDFGLENVSLDMLIPNLVPDRFCQSSGIESL